MDRMKYWSLGVLFFGELVSTIFNGWKTGFIFPTLVVYVIFDLATVLLRVRTGPLDVESEVRFWNTILVVFAFGALVISNAL